MIQDQAPSLRHRSALADDTLDAGCSDRSEEWRVRVREVEDLLSGTDVALARIRERAASLAAIAAHIRATGEIPPGAAQIQQIEEREG